MFGEYVHIKLSLTRQTGLIEQTKLNNFQGFCDRKFIRLQLEDIVKQLKKPSNISMPKHLGLLTVNSQNSVPETVICTASTTMKTFKSRFNTEYKHLCYSTHKYDFLRFYFTTDWPTEHSRLICLSGFNGTFRTTRLKRATKNHEFC